MKESKAGQAALKKSNGYNCCQSIVSTYAEDLGLNKETAYAMAEGFAAGIAGSGNVCGAVTGMVMLAGIKESSGGPEKGMTIGKTMKLSGKMMDEFEKKNGTCICRDLLGQGGKKLRSCPGCILDAGRIIEENLFPGEFEEYTGEEF